MSKAHSNSRKTNPVLAKLFQQKIRAQHYHCAQCNLKQGSYAIKTGFGVYEPADEFEASHARRNNQTVIKVFLRMIDLKINQDPNDIINYVLLCPHHAQQAVKKQVQETRKKNLGGAGKITFTEIEIIKNFTKNNFGVELSTPAVIQLVLLISNFIEDEPQQLS